MASWLKKGGSLWSRTMQWEPGPGTNRALDGALAVMTLFIVVLVHRSVYSYFIGKELYHVKTDRTFTAHLPKWSEGLFDFRSVCRDRLGPGLSLHQRDLTKVVAVAMEKAPWIRRTTRVEKTGHGLRIDVELRRPVATIEQDGRFYLSDREGVRLPGSFSLPPDLPLPIVLVQGIEEPVPVEGRTWHSLKARESIALINLFAAADVYGKAPVPRLEIADDPGSGRPRITAYIGPRVPVVWGTGVIDPADGEPRLSEKLRSLYATLEYFPRLRGVSGVDLSMYPNRAVVTVMEPGEGGQED